METKENLKKLCSFYVSDIHFGTMILPYISKKIEQRNNIYTIFEKDMHKNIEKLLSSLSLKKETKEEINNIDWNKKVGKKEINDYIATFTNDNQTILIMGNKKYIDKTNKKIERKIKKEKSNDVTIINAYNVEVFNQNIVEILKTHNGILNTSGERKIEV